MARFGLASGGYTKEQVQGNTRRSVRRRSGACVSAFALMTSMALGVPVLSKKVLAADASAPSIIVNGKDSTLTSVNRCSGLSHSALCTSAAGDSVENYGSIDLNQPTQNYVSGIYVGKETDGGRATVTNADGALIKVTGGKRAYGIEADPFTNGNVTVVNQAGAQIDVTSAASDKGGIPDTSAVGISAYLGNPKGGTGDNTVSLSNLGSIRAQSSGVQVDAVGMEVWSALGGGATAAHNNSGILDNQGSINAVASGANASAVGMRSYLDGKDNTGVISNSGRIDVDASGTNGNAYGVYTALSGNSISVVRNTGVIRTSGTNAHELYVSAVDVKDGSGTAYVAEWNLLLPAAVAADQQKTFKVDKGSTLNFSNGETGDKAAGSRLILRSQSDHSSSKITDLVYRSDTGVVAGVIDSVASGGDADGKDAADYQATLEGYNDYTNQTVYLDRALQNNAAGNVRDGSGCAFGTCGLYSSTYGLGVSNDGIVDVVTGKDRVGSGLFVNLRRGDKDTAVGMLNTGRVNVDAGMDGTAYGVFARLQGDNQTANIANTGIVNVSGATAHQLYVTGLTGIGAGTANLLAWNLSPVAAVSEDQKAFAVAAGATLNLGDGKGNGTQLILRTNDAGNNGHNGAAVSDLIANKGGTVTGVIDAVYSGGNVDGKDAADYQATLEGYNNYTQQSVYIDRAWQSNAARNVRDGSGCAFGTCGLYSSTYGLGVSNDGTVDVVTGKDTVGSGLFVNLRRGDKDTAVGMLNTGRVNVDAGMDGTAYGVFARLQGDNQTANIANTGIVNVSGATAHQLYVTGLTGIGAGTANLLAWNLSPVAAVSEDQKAFAVAAGATLNLGDGKGNGTQLILRTNDAGNNDHNGAAVSDLIANKGGTVTGVIDAVYSGGNVDGKDAADYQATLEGYNDYTQQSVYIDRAWQFNAAGDTMNAVQCATITCSLYSSTQGLGLVNAGILDADFGNSVGAGMYANLRTMAGIANRPVSLSNSGTITMKAGDGGAAYGMYARLQDANQVANIANTGIIDVQGGTAHQLYISGMPGVGGGTANVTSWNLDLYDRQSGHQSVFAVADGATLNFSNTSMMLRPGDVAKGYADNKKFNVKDMVYNYGNGAQVTGQIGSVSTPLPMLTAAYGRVDQNGTDVWDNQWVSLNVEAEKGDGPTVNAGTVDSMQSQIDRVGNLLVGGASGGGIGLGDGDLTSVQLKVYYGNQQRRGVGASVTDSTGTVAYADYEIGEGHTLGWHGGVEYAHLRAKSKTLNVNSLSAILGGQGRYNFSDTTYLRGQVSGILSNNNNHFNAFDGSTSKVSTINFGMYGAVYAGYDYKPDENNTVTPEIGLSALWSHTPSMDVKYDRSPDLNHTYAAQNYTALYANAGVRWTGGIDINGTLLKPTVMAGVRQTLGDGKVKSAMTFNGNRFDTSITRDRTMGIVDAGVSTTVSTGFDVGLNYRGEYGSNTTNHVGYLNATIRF